MMEEKGSGIKDLPKIIKEKFGEEKYQEWFNALPQESKNIYGKQILSSVWYPLKYSHYEPDMVAQKLFFNGDPKRFREIGVAAADSMFTGVYKFFVKLGSPNKIVEKGSSIISTLLRPMKHEIIESGSNKAIVRFTDFPELYEAFEYNIAGTIERVLELAGGKNVRVGIATSIARGDEYTEFVCTWD